MHYHNPEILRACAMGPSPLCNKCGDKRVTVQISNDQIVYHCHGETESHPDLEGFKHAEKAF